MEVVEPVVVEEVKQESSAEATPKKSKKKQKIKIEEVDAVVEETTPEVRFLTASISSRSYKWVKFSRHL